MRFPDIIGYQYEDLLGEDPFGWTFVATHESGKRRVIKVFKAQATCDRFLRSYFETFTRQSPSLDGVAPVYDHVPQEPDALTACAQPFYGWKDRENGRWRISSLKRLQHLLSHEQVVEVAEDLACRIGEIHEAGLFHGGLRPSGVFLTGDSQGGQKIRITDFGQIYMGGLHHLEAGEWLFYASPEQIASGDFADGRGQGWDVYAFGVIAFQLLTGHLPRLDQLRRHSESHPEWLEAAPAILAGERTELSEHFLQQLEIERSVEWPDEPGDEREKNLREVIGQCLRFDPRNRPADMGEVARRIAGAGPLASLAPDGQEPVATTRTATAAAASTAAEPVPAEDATPSLAESGAFAEVGLEEVPLEKGRASVSFFAALRDRPVARWQAISVASVVGVLCLSCFLLISTLKIRKMEAQVQDDLSKAQSEVDKAAAAYRRQRLTLQSETEQLKSELDSVENSKSSLLGEAKLARQILRQAQENGDRFFQLVLENRDSDIEDFRAGRARALVEGRKHYERLVDVYGDAPDFIVSTANALFYLGRIYKEMGEFGKSLASFGEAERRYSALLEDSSTSDPEFVKNIAISKSALGQLAMTSGQYSVARHYFTESSRFWSEVRGLLPEESHTAGLHIHGNSLDIVECEFAMGRQEAALDAALSIGVQLTRMQEETPQDHRVIAAIARSFSLGGRVLEAREDVESATQAYQQSSDLYARAIQLDAAVDAYQLGLGNSLARLGLLTHDYEKLESAAEVLGAVIAANPYESPYLKTLADIYGALASNQRDGGQLENAIALEQKAIAILKPILKGNKALSPDVRYSYSQRLSHLADLLGDSGKFDESRIPLKEAISVLEALVDSDAKVVEYRRSLARARGMVGFACVKAGDNTEARKHLELARTEWQNFVVSHPEDTDAAQAVKWTSEQIMRLP
ncbi:MAG: hypothetical protein GXX91_03530 [Verrucomicrobiaceae bacterium]|nr:hypothetical protein [Verrucomicrobiaceae bacterium]